MLRHTVLLWLYPALRQWPPAEWRAVLARAGAGAFDTLEWIGLASALGVTAWLGAEAKTLWAGWPLPLALALQLAQATALLALLAGPFLVRRTRRGLDGELRHPRQDPRRP